MNDPRLLGFTDAQPNQRRTPNLIARHVLGLAVLRQPISHSAPHRVLSDGDRYWVFAITGSARNNCV